MDTITAAAVSLTVSGNSGISSFLTLFLMGCLQRFNPDLLHMDETMSWVLASIPSLALLGLLTVAEFVAMCVPVVDELTDTVMTFVVPLVSILGTLGTFGLYSNAAVDNQENDETRDLSVASKSLAFFQFVVLAAGAALAISMHLFKMLVRPIGEGWLTNILTVVETSWCITSLLMAVFIKAMAVAVALIFLVATAWHWRRRCRKQQEKRQQAEEQRSQPNSSADNYQVMA